jgi:glycine/D-amino acid oxidase-like deaminating enzyme
MPAYAGWSLKSSELWSGFADELKERTGLDVEYTRGGFDIAADDAELEAFSARLRQIESEMGPAAYGYRILDHAELKAEVSAVGNVPGATYTEHDGHCNPLILLRAMHQDFQALGGAYRPKTPVEEVRPHAGGGFDVIASDGATLARAEKVIIAAGHGSQKLTDPLGIDLPIHADQGQVLVTEKAERILQHANSSVRQTESGAFMLGPSSKKVGLDTRTDLETLGQIARRCVKIFPFLARLRLQRTWAALRVMTPDGCPVYQQSEAHPGAFSFCCHSGVTLAACHALEVTKWVIDGAIPQSYAAFHPRRFHVQTA